MSLKAFIQAWNDFFFKPTSPMPVAIFRILYGLLVVIMLITQSMPDWDFWYGPNSPVQNDVLRDFFFRCPVFNYFDVVPGWANHYVMWVVLAAAVCLTIGLFTRFSCVIVWLSLTSLDHQNPWNISGSDDMMRLLAFCLMFTQAGAMFSVDSWWKRKRHPDQVQTLYAPWGQRMVQIQLAVAYWGASVAKLGGNQWVDGTAVYYSSHMEDFFRLPTFHLFDNLLFCQMLSWGTLVVETSLWTLIWFKETRYWVLLAGVLLHISIDYAMALPIFEMLFVATYTTFVEPADYIRLWNWLKSLTVPFGVTKKQASPAVALSAQRVDS